MPSGGRLGRRAAEAGGEPQRVTSHNASRTMRLESFEWPCSRSRNVIGTSDSVAPSSQDRRTSSIWNP